MKYSGSYSVLVLVVLLIISLILTVVIGYQNYISPALPRFATTRQPSEASASRVHSLTQKMDSLNRRITESNNKMIWLVEEMRYLESKIQSNQKLSTEGHPLGGNFASAINLTLQPLAKNRAATLEASQVEILQGSFLLTNATGDELYIVIIMPGGEYMQGANRKATFLSDDGRLPYVWKMESLPTEQRITFSINPPALRPGIYILDIYAGRKLIGSLTKELF